MKLAKFLFIPPIVAISVSLFLALGAQATDVFVSKSGNDANDGLSPDTAKASIQAAADLFAESTVHVAKGIYEPTDYIVLTNATTLVGEEGTILHIKKTIGISNDCAVVKNLTIAGYYDKGSVRGVYLFGKGTIDGCVISNFYGTTQVSASRWEAGNSSNWTPGAGVLILGEGTVRNCVLQRNCCHMWGAAIYMTGNGLVESCVITNCTAYGGGNNGAIFMSNGTVRNSLIAKNRFGVNCTATGVVLTGGTMESCTVVDNANTSKDNPGVSCANATVRNCIIWNNTGSAGLNNCKVGNGGKVTYTCTTPKATGDGNIDTAPAFKTGGWQLDFCDAVDHGLNNDGWMTDAKDLGVNARILNGTVDMGCYEMVPQALNVKFNVTSDGAADSSAVVCTADVTASDPSELENLTYTWTIRNSLGETVRYDEKSTNARYETTLVAGLYSFCLSVSNGKGDPVDAEKIDHLRVGASVTYANVNGSGVYPYASEATGAPNIADAVTATAENGTVYVCDGTYPTPARLTLGQAMTVRSVNGPEAVKITNGATAFELVYISAAGVTFSGFTLTSENTEAVKVSRLINMSAAGTVTNCVMRDTRGADRNPGVGIYLTNGTLVDCDILRNVSLGTGASPTRGVGVCADGRGCKVLNCRIIGNRGTGGWGDAGASGLALANGATARNCLVVGGEHTSGPGLLADSGAKAENCTVLANTNKNDGTSAYIAGKPNTYPQSAGVNMQVNAQGASSLINCIVASNIQVRAGGVLVETNVQAAATATFKNSDLRKTDLAALAGEALIDEDPLFVDYAAGDYRIRFSSPCRNTGLFATWMNDAVDVLGQPRLVSRKVDMGACECQVRPGMTVFVR